VLEQVLATAGFPQNKFRDLHKLVPRSVEELVSLLCYPEGEKNSTMLHYLGLLVGKDVLDNTPDIGLIQCQERLAMAILSLTDFPELSGALEAPSSSGAPPVLTHVDNFRHLRRGLLSSLLGRAPYSTLAALLGRARDLGLQRPQGTVATEGAVSLSFLTREKAVTLFSAMAETVPALEDRQRVVWMAMLSAKREELISSSRTRYSALMAVGTILGEEWGRSAGATKRAGELVSPAGTDPGVVWGALRCGLPWALDAYSTLGTGRPGGGQSTDEVPDLFPGCFLLTSYLRLGLSEGVNRTRFLALLGSLVEEGEWTGERLTTLLTAPRTDQLTGHGLALELSSSSHGEGVPLALDRMLHVSSNARREIEDLGKHVLLPRTSEDEVRISLGAWLSRWSGDAMSAHPESILDGIGVAQGMISALKAACDAGGEEVRWKEMSAGAVRLAESLLGATAQLLWGA